jgi:hypothetical protein
LRIIFKAKFEVYDLSIVFKATVIYSIKGYELRENLKIVQIYDLRTRFKVIFKDIS